MAPKRQAPANEDLKSSKRQKIKDARAISVQGGTNKGKATNNVRFTADSECHIILRSARHSIKWTKHIGLSGLPGSIDVEKFAEVSLFPQGYSTPVFSFV